MERGSGAGCGCPGVCVLGVLDADSLVVLLPGRMDFICPCVYNHHNTPRTTGIV